MSGYLQSKEIMCDPFAITQAKSHSIVGSGLDTTQDALKMSLKGNFIRNLMETQFLNFTSQLSF